MLGYNLILFVLLLTLFHLGHWELFQLAYVPLTYPCVCMCARVCVCVCVGRWVSQHFFFSGTRKCLRLISYIFCFSRMAIISHFSKESRFLLLENSIRNQDLSVLIACFHFQRQFCRIGDSCLTVFFSFSPQNMLSCCLLASSISDEKSAIAVIWFPLYVITCVSLLLSLFSLCLVIQHFGYDVSGYGFLSNLLLRVC